MLGRRKKGPDKVFSHGAGCRIVAADPGVQIQWSNTGSGRWEAVCVCGIETWYKPAAERVRLDPLDAKASRHAPECEFASETDPAVLRVLLKVNDGAGGDYWLAECGSCSCSWQVPNYAEESVG